MSQPSPSEGASPQPDVQLAVPPRIGRYVIRKRLDVIAFPLTYLGYDPALEREVTVKVFRSEEFTPESRERVLREVRAAAMVQHPNVCPVYEVSTDGELSYIVMRYVDGSTLAGLFSERKQPFPVRSAVAIARKLALGLSAAHERGVIHRRLNPQNVLYDKASRDLFVTGFAESRLERENCLTASGALDGALAYTAPEQLLGQQGEVGPAADVYSLGVILYEMLTGQPPFTGSPVEVMIKHAVQSPLQPSARCPGLDPNLDSLVLKALAKNPTDRYPSAKAFADALADQLRGGELPRLEALPRGEEPEHPTHPPSSADFELAQPSAAQDEDDVDWASVVQNDEGAECSAVHCPAESPTVELDEMVDDDGCDLQLGESSDEMSGTGTHTPLAGSALGEKETLRCPRCMARLEVTRGRTRPIDCPSCGLRFAVEAGRPAPVRVSSSARAPADDEGPARQRGGIPRSPRRAAPVSRKPAAVEVPCPITDKVHFSVTAPAALRPGHRYALSVWAHLAAQRTEVVARAKEAYPGGPVKIRTKGGVRVTRGTVLTVRLRIPGFKQPPRDEIDVIEWDGEIGSATFPVLVPAGASQGSYLGTVLIFADGLQIAKLHFDLEVARGDAPARVLESREVRHKTAFASYAREDREAVLARIQGMQKTLPELEIFHDVESLRSQDGWDERLEKEVTRWDVFYLFWSASASESEWVEREWRAALKVRGLDYIDPVPLVDPKAVPPPPELAPALDFNDWVLAYLRGAGFTRRPRRAAGRWFRWRLAILEVALVLILLCVAIFAWILARPGD